MPGALKTQLAWTWVLTSTHTSWGAPVWESMRGRGLPKVPFWRNIQARPGPLTGPMLMVAPRCTVRVTPGSWVFQPSQTTSGFWVWGDDVPALAGPAAHEVVGGVGGRVHEGGVGDVQGGPGGVAPHRGRTGVVTGHDLPLAVHHARADVHVADVNDGGAAGGGLVRGDALGQGGVVRGRGGGGPRRARAQDGGQEGQDGGQAPGTQAGMTRSHYRLQYSVGQSLTRGSFLTL